MPASTDTPTNVSLDTIAEHLNLSTATVSRALRNVPGTHPRTRSLVMNAAVELGYRPQRTRSRSVSSSTQKTVGVLMHGFQDGRSLAFLEGLTHAANELEVTLSLHKFERSQADNVSESLKKALARQENLTGLLLMHHWGENMVRYLTDHYDCISLVHHYPYVSLDVVDMNHVQGIGHLIGHLRALGHLKVGFIGRNADMSWARSRFGGYSQMMYSMGLPYNPDWIIDVPTVLLEETSLVDQWAPMVDRVAELVESGVTAWMGSSDWVGYVLCRGLLDRGLRVPQDVSITGFDNDEPQALGCPRVTSVQVPKQQMGAEALARLLRHRDGTPQAQHTSLFECALTIGQTTGSPPT